ncbi:cation transporter [Vibrio tubiashii]|nr:cation transporter [Vibrio tubiashii]
MKRDVFGICLSRGMLTNNLSSTFTHVRAYQRSEENEDVTVMHAFPQMSGQELLTNMKGSTRLLWRAEFVCSDMK